MMLDLGSNFPSGSDPRTGVVLTGACEIPLERAVLLYRPLPDSAGSGGRVLDLGLGVVIEAGGASRARVMDLGSGEIRDAELAPPFVLLGWIFPRLFREIQGLLDPTNPSENRLRWSRKMVFPLLREMGLSPLTRSTFQRLGFQDLCLDLDLHEEAAVRLHLGEAGPVRAHLESERSLLVFRTGKSSGLPELEGMLAEAFPLFPLSRRRQGEGRLTVEFGVHLPVRLEWAPLRRDLAAVRSGFEVLIKHFEPRRFEAYRSALSAFGERDALARLDSRSDRGPSLSRPDRGAQGSPPMGRTH